MLTRDRLIAALAEMGTTPDYQRLAADVLGIRHAPPELAKRLVSQALVIEDRRDRWREVGDRVSAAAPSAAGVYVLLDANDRALYVGKAVNLRRRLRAHFAERRWRRVKPALARAADARWVVVGSELEALLREATLIEELRPEVNVQVGLPELASRDIPSSLVRDVLVAVPSIEEDSAELIAARVDGGWLIQRTRRNGADLAVHTSRLWRFFQSPLRERFEAPPLAPIVFSWLAGRGASASRVDPHDVTSPRDLRTRLAVLLADERLFAERIAVINSKITRP